MSGPRGDQGGDELAAFVLDLDQAGLEGGAGGDSAPAVDAQAPGGERGGLRLEALGGEGCAGFFAGGLEEIDAQVERRGLERGRISAASCGPKRDWRCGRIQSGISRRTASGISGCSSVWPWRARATSASGGMRAAGAYWPPEKALCRPPRSQPSTSREAATRRRGVGRARARSIHQARRRRVRSTRQARSETARRSPEPM